MNGEGLEVAHPDYLSCFTAEIMLQASLLPKINPAFIGLSLHTPAVALARSVRCEPNKYFDVE